MKSLVLLAVWAAFPAAAQQPVSPEVQPDGRVTFRLRARNAASVSVHCEGVRETGMVKDEQGVWSLTTAPLPPDLYAYSFTVDGVRMMDPANPLLKYNLIFSESQAHVPGPASLPWEINDVPRGRLHYHPCRSAIAGDERKFIVYTPPGYDAASRKTYPVLYLLHGFSDATDSWLQAGLANVILDNLMARGQAKPMLVVLPSGYGTMDVIKDYTTPLHDPTLARRNVEMFRDTLLHEVIPQTEKAYRVAGDAAHRAIAGLSMGGNESLFTGLNAPDKFAWIGAFSAGGMSTNFPANYPALGEKANQQLRLLWISCGSEDRLVTINRNLSDWLTARGVRHTFVETPGAHTYQVWRRDLAQFAPLLFQPKK
ncbi:MAG: alpha/beta hydrolase-fold protein [Verrucomicrobiota bacterium]|jgi:enterochelin esterase family protein